MKIQIENSHRITALVREAGEALKDLWPKNNSDRQVLEIQEKNDASLVSLADLRSNEILISGLQKLFPGCEIVSEEGTTGKVSSENNNDNLDGYWLIDPLDGTKEFLEGRDNFAVLVAFIDSDHIPIAGWVYFPVRDLLFAAVDGELLPDSDPVTITPQITEHSIYLRSSDMEKELQNLKRLEESALFTPQGKHSGEAFAQFFMGEISGCVLELGRLGIWDIAAPLAVAKACGAKGVTLDNKPYLITRGSKAVEKNTTLVLSHRDTVSELLAQYNKISNEILK